MPDSGSGSGPRSSTASSSWVPLVIAFIVDRGIGHLSAYATCVNNAARPRRCRQPSCKGSFLKLGRRLGADRPRRRARLLRHPVVAVWRDPRPADAWSARRRRGDRQEHRHRARDGRFVGYVISGFALDIGFIWVAFDARKQAGTTRSPAHSWSAKSRIRQPTCRPRRPPFEEESDRGSTAAPATREPTPQPPGVPPPGGPQPAGPPQGPYSPGGAYAGQMHPSSTSRNRCRSPSWSRCTNEPSG